MARGLGMILRCVLMLGICGSAPASPALGEETWVLDGKWLFRTDEADRGLVDGWNLPGASREGWSIVRVPHTWQVEPGLEDYRGVAWYATEFPPSALSGSQHRRIEFDAIYRDATVWLNGKKLGEHLGSGWTPFAFALDDAWRFEGENLVVVRVDNRFSNTALPYSDSSDWAADGGIIRSVRLTGWPRDAVKQVLIDAAPEEGLRSARIGARIELVCPDCSGDRVRLGLQVTDPNGQLVKRLSQVARDGPNRLSWEIGEPALWHFDRPQLYRLAVDVEIGGSSVHRRVERFGVRSVDIRGGFVFLNGEPMRLMGVEWMPGSDPRHGMAEGPDQIAEVLRELKRLNAVFTRFHWQQDRSVLEFSDREGLLVQEEIPAWGPRTMEADLTVVQTLQTREMVAAHYNHPSIFAWGLCNEIDGQRPESHAFVRKGIELVRELDRVRPLTWASNSLQTSPELDASSLVDFIEWNDYWESWYKGSLSDLKSNLAAISGAFPGKSVVISEYGLCECDPGNPSGDERRIEILKTHTDLYRAAPQVAGAIFFSFNDYRTHIGDKGEGSFQQRVHGVVDLLGRRKPSWEALRRESSPIRSLAVAEPREDGRKVRTGVSIRTRSLQNDLPAYTLRGYTLVWTAYNSLGQPMAGGKSILPDLEPGTAFQGDLEWHPFERLERVRVEVFRPTGYSVLDSEWRK